MTVWVVLGWVGQALFFSRFFVQWLASERAKKSVAPPVFWWLSLVATVLLALYSYGTDLPLFLAVFVVNCAVYLRNVTLGWFEWKLPRPAAVLFAGAAVAALLFGGGLRADKYELDSAAGAWFFVGTVGAVLWALRFPLQWWLSEWRGHSHFPRAFWWVSLAGNLLLLAYAIHLGRAVLIAGFATGPLVQVRNLMLSSEARRAARGAVEDAEAAADEPTVELAPRPARERAAQAPPSPRR